MPCARDPIAAHDLDLGAFPPAESTDEISDTDTSRSSVTLAARRPPVDRVVDHSEQPDEYTTTSAPDRITTSCAFHEPVRDRVTPIVSMRVQRRHVPLPRPSSPLAPAGTPAPARTPERDDRVAGDRRRSALEEVQRRSSSSVRNPSVSAKPRTSAPREVSTTRRCRLERRPRLSLLRANPAPCHRALLPPTSSFRRSKNTM